MNCFQAKAGQVAPQWFVIDAADMVVGRLAAQIAPILMGKHRPTYTAHIDTGDFVIVTNVDKVVFTGQKWTQKSYQRYSGHPGGQKEEQALKLFQRRPARILELAIQRMMPKSKIGRHMMAKLKLYVGPQHPHQAQSPMPLEPKSGRPSSAGLIAALPQVVNPPRRNSRPKPAADGDAAATTTTPEAAPVATLPDPATAVDPAQTAMPAEMAAPVETAPPTPEPAAPAAAPAAESAEPPPTQV